MIVSIDGQRWQEIFQGADPVLLGNRLLSNKVNVHNPYWISYPGRNENLTGYADPNVKTNSDPDK